MAKGYGIILMLIGHLHVNELMVWIYSFHMPLFFFVSGYLFNIKSNFLEFSAGKVKRMLIPYLFLYIPMLLSELLFEGALSTGQVLEHLKLNLLQQRHSALWFLGCLIVLHFLYYPLVRYVTNRILGAVNGCPIQRLLSGYHLSYCWRHAGVFPLSDTLANTHSYSMLGITPSSCCQCSSYVTRWVLFT